MKRSQEEFHRNWISFRSHFRHRILFNAAFIRRFFLFPHSSALLRSPFFLSLSLFLFLLSSLSATAFLPLNIEPEENGAAFAFSFCFPPPSSFSSLFPFVRIWRQFRILFSLLHRCQVSFNSQPVAHVSKYGTVKHD